MTEVVHVSARELTASEMLDILDRGDRVVVTTTVLGERKQQVVREQGGTYYCETPTKLLIRESEAEMRTCLERTRLTKSDDSIAAEPA